MLTDQDYISTKIGAAAVDDLYHLDVKNESCALAATTNTKTTSDYTLWHHRLGHPGRNTLSNIAKYVDGLPDINLLQAEGETCEACKLAKSHRLPFAAFATNRSNNVLERIHTDLCGPMHLPSLKGSRYILTFIDDSTRYAKVYFIEKKSDTFDCFVRYRTLVEKQTGERIKILRSDGGGEYVNDRMRDLFSENGILHETTVADTPQQNGVAERYNRTMLESLRAMMHAANVPAKLWAELITMVVYLRNRLPTRANTNNTTPYKRWFNRKPSVKHLRVIWSDAFAHVPKHKQPNKLAPRATKLKLLGYHDEKKAYKLWNPTTEQIEISRDVVFDESVVLTKPRLVPDSGYDEYQVESIIDQRNKDGITEYLVKWLGYDDDKNTWEPHAHVADLMALDIWEQQ